MIRIEHFRAPFPNLGSSVVFLHDSTNPVPNIHKPMTGGDVSFTRQLPYLLATMPTTVWMHGWWFFVCIDFMHPHGLDKVSTSKCPRSDGLKEGT